jgi:hypothetical protein
MNLVLNVVEMEALYRQDPPPAAAPMASSARSAAWRAPGGLPAGLPDLPGVNRRPGCFGPVFSGNAASIRRDDQHLGNWARGGGAAIAAPSEPGRYRLGPPWGPAAAGAPHICRRPVRGIWLCRRAQRREDGHEPCRAIRRV